MQEHDADCLYKFRHDPETCADLSARLRQAFNEREDRRIEQEMANLGFTQADVDTIQRRINEMIQDPPAGMYWSHPWGAPHQHNTMAEALQCVQNGRSESNGVKPADPIDETKEAQMTEAKPFAPVPLTDAYTQWLETCLAGRSG